MHKVDAKICIFILTMIVINDYCAVFFAKKGSQGITALLPYPNSNF